MDNLPNDQKCPHSGRYNNRRLAIDALIVRDNKILLVKRANDPFKDFWSNPGGGVDWDETAEDAVRKEVKEATREVKAGSDAKDAQWFDLDNLPKSLAFDHETIIEEYLKIIRA